MLGIDGSGVGIEQHEYGMERTDKGTSVDVDVYAGGSNGKACGECSIYRRRGPYFRYGFLLFSCVDI